LAGIFNGAITGSIGGVFYITLGGPLAIYPGGIRAGIRSLEFLNTNLIIRSFKVIIDNTNPRILNTDDNPDGIGGSNVNMIIWIAWDDKPDPNPIIPKPNPDDP